MRSKSFVLFLVNYQRSTTLRYRLDDHLQSTITLDAQIRLLEMACYYRRMRNGRCLLPIILVLCLLTGCAGRPPTAATATATAQAANQECSPIGRTHLALAPALWPNAQGDWPLFHGNQQRTGAIASHHGNTLNLAWSSCTGGPIFSSPVVHNEIVYIGSLDKTLTALAIRSGNKLWQQRTDDGFYSTPAIADGIIYAASLETLYAFDAQTGTIRWHQRVEEPGGKFWSSPVVADGMVIIGVASSLSEHPKVVGQVLAFDAQTGALRWRARTSLDGSAGSGVWSSPAVDEQKGVIYVATSDPDDGVQALALHDGHLLWHWRSVAQDISDTDIGAGPTIYPDQQGQMRVVVGGKNGVISSLDAQTGQVLWQTRIGQHVFSTPTFVNGTLLVVGASGSRSSRTWALDAQTGAVRWQGTPSLMTYASPATDGSVCYLPIGNGFALGQGRIDVIQNANGHVLQSVPLPSTTTSSPALLPGWLFVGARDGNLYAFLH